MSGTIKAHIRAAIVGILMPTLEVIRTLIGSSVSTGVGIGIGIDTGTSIGVGIGTSPVPK